MARGEHEAVTVAPAWVLFTCFGVSRVEGLGFRFVVERQLHGFPILAPNITRIHVDNPGPTAFVHNDPSP